MSWCGGDVIWCYGTLTSSFLMGRSLSVEPESTVHTTVACTCTCTHAHIYRCGRYLGDPLQALNEPTRFQKELVVLPELFIYGLHESLVITWNEVVALNQIMTMSILCL